MVGQDLICRRQWNYKCDGHGNRAAEQQFQKRLAAAKLSACCLQAANHCMTVARNAIK
jgi:hypothetical protein